MTDFNRREAIVAECFKPLDEKFYRSFTLHCTTSSVVLGVSVDITREESIKVRDLIHKFYGWGQYTILRPTLHVELIKIPEAVGLRFVDRTLGKVIVASFIEYRMLDLQMVFDGEVNVTARGAGMIEGEKS